MEFRYGTSFGAEPPEAYERLLLDCMLGDGTLFTRGDEVEASWAWVSRIHRRWAEEAAARQRRTLADLPRRQLGTRRGGPAAGRRRARLAAAVTTLQRRRTRALRRGEPIAVEVGEIERALGALWQQASRAGDDHATAVSRAALWNVIILARGRDALAATKQLVDEMAPALPTRTITLCLEDRMAPIAWASRRACRRGVRG